MYSLVHKVRNRLGVQNAEDHKYGLTNMKLLADRPRADASAWCERKMMSVDLEVSVNDDGDDHMAICLISTWKAATLASKARLKEWTPSQILILVKFSINMSLFLKSCW